MAGVLDQGARRRLSASKKQFLQVNPLKVFKHGTL